MCYWVRGRARPSVYHTHRAPYIYYIHLYAYICLIQFIHCHDCKHLHTFTCYFVKQNVYGLHALVCICMCRPMCLCLYVHVCVSLCLVMYVCTCIGWFTADKNRLHSSFRQMADIVSSLFTRWHHDLTQAAIMPCNEEV